MRKRRTDAQREMRHRKRWERNNPGVIYPGYTRWSKEQLDNISKNSRGKNLGQPNHPMRGKPSKFKGKHHTESAKALCALGRRGKPLSEAHKKKISMAGQGVIDEKDWVGFVKPKPHYCWKWRDPKLKIRKRVRAWWGNKCAGCGATRADAYHRYLHVDHIGNDKRACCTDNPGGWLFVPLCSSCHGLAGGKYQEPADKKYTELIMTKYGGKCYYTLEEYEALVSKGALNTEDYGRRDGR